MNSFSSKTLTILSTHIHIFHLYSRKFCWLRSCAPTYLLHMSAWMSHGLPSAAQNVTLPFAPPWTFRCIPPHQWMISKLNSVSTPASHPDTLHIKLSIKSVPSTSLKCLHLTPSSYLESRVWSHISHPTKVISSALPVFKLRNPSTTAQCLYCSSSDPSAVEIKSHPALLKILPWSPATFRLRININKWKSCNVNSSYYLISFTFPTILWIK